ncbi:SCO family protein [Sporosarcina sp. G11-34]|uniref:SCO family protein n=1 Tax=Sporosarcina sp. G11-34 TaxID=2849605 RepID=UPI0022A97198|nr:SCO family protein [Sporosarcina sp. G11-34]MCZ2257854.1 SCO family protein [Sporosarcina sp. G11-34]
MRKSHWLLILSLLFLSACGSHPQQEKTIVPFTFTDQHGQPFGTDNLTGTIWVTNFIFTNCTTVCPPMTIEMAKLQEQFHEKEIDAQFVSFTVDPSVDSPDVLNEYLQNFTDDDSNWHTLTGYSQETIETFAREQFQTMVQKPSSSNQVIHGTNFYLIDRNGTFVNEYNYIDNSYVEEMIKDIQKR